MLSKLKRTKLQKTDKGFTIIEVMIVLAIAGLILLIVFLAVPALQRSARNTQRKNDIGNIDTAINNYVSNNNGQLPTTVTLATGAITVSGSGVSSNDGKVGYYPDQVVTVLTYGNAEQFASAPPSNFLGLFATANAAAPTVGPDSFSVTSGATCQGGSLTSGGTGVAISSARDFAITYELEQSGSTATGKGIEQCQGS